MAKEDRSEFAGGIARPANPPQPASATLAEQARREGKKSLTETHLNELMEKTRERPDLIAKLPQAAPGTPSLLPKEVQEQALRVELARARNIPSGNRPAPEPRCYNVVHNGQEFKKVYAKDALEAWARVCDGEKSWPSPKTALVTEVNEEGEPVSDSDRETRLPAKEKADHSAETSPVANQNAGDAADSISRMNSRRKLEQIIESDQRKTVTEAAQRRLDELGDKAE